MANRASAISGLPVLTAPAGEDLLVIVDDPSGVANTKQVTVTNLLTNSTSHFTVGNTYNLSANTLIVRNSATPANSTANVVQGTIWYDSTYLYVATANNVIKRIALSAF